MMADEDSWLVIVLTAVVSVFVLCAVLFAGFFKKKDTPTTTEKAKGKSEASSGNTTKKQRSSWQPKKDQSRGFIHSWVACQLKMHSSPVLALDFSPNGKYIATCAEDRIVAFWLVKDVEQKERKGVRTNVELDHATRIKFSPDNKAFIASIYNENTVRVYKFSRKADGLPGNFEPVLDFPKKHTAEIINIGIASSGKFVMTCSRDTMIIVWTLKGDVLNVINTNQVNNAFAAVSPCGRFIASSGFTPDVKVWEVCFDKTGNFKDVSRAFELKGHSAGVYCFSFSSDSNRMATVSKDGTWKLWNTNVEYQLKQDPYLLKTGKYTNAGPCLIALAPNALSVAIATGPNLIMCDTEDLSKTTALQNVFSGQIVGLEFAPTGSYLAAAGDKHVCIFLNVVGLQATIHDLETKKKEATSQGLRERLQQQIDQARLPLQKLQGVDR